MWTSAVSEVLSISTSFKISPQVTTKMFLQIQLQRFRLFNLELDLFDQYLKKVHLDLIWKYRL